MHTRSLFAKAVAIACAALAFGASTASAQAWHYPTLQTPGDLDSRLHLSRRRRRRLRHECGRAVARRVRPDAW